MPRVAASGQQTIARMAEAGYLMPGWTPQTWQLELRRKAIACQARRPELAKLYERWAEALRPRRTGPDMAEILLFAVPPPLLDERITED